VYVPPPKIAPPAEQAIARTQAHAQALASQFRDAGPAGDYGIAAANAFKQTPAYKQTVLNVFQHQNASQRQAIVKGALTNTASPEAKMIRDYVSQTGGSGSDWTTAAIHGATVRAALPALSGFEKVLSNAAMDAANLPAETLSSIAANAGALKDVLTPGKTGKGLGELGNIYVKPYVQTVEHPKMLLQHPLNEYLMWAGPLHGLTRLAAAPVRALAPESAAGGALSLERPGVAVTGRLTAERPQYSPYPLIKAGQVALEKAAYRRNETGELVPRGAQRLARQVNQGVGEMVGVQERIRRANRGAVLDARESAIRPSRAVRAAKAVAQSWRYGPEAPTIPGANVLTRIADATIRRPDTVEHDLQLHREQVAANRPNLVLRPRDLAAHDAYVAELDAALNNKAFLRNPVPAFKAAAAYHRDYVPVQNKAQALGHYGDMTREALDRRALYHYASTHMGARVEVDPAKWAAYERALEALPKQHPDWSFGQLQAALRRVRPEPQLLVDKAAAAGRDNGVRAAPLGLQEILDHLNGPNGTGGRMPTYTPDYASLEPELTARRARYVPQVERPMPARGKNMLYNYTHGLTDPTHASLTDQHVLLQGIVDAHHAQNQYAETLALSKEDGSWWNSYHAAASDAPRGYRPIRLSGPFHPQTSLDMAMDDVHPADIEEEAVRHSLDLNARLQPGGAGRYGIISDQALRALRQHQNQISPGAFWRSVRGLNTQFRTVALATSFRHVPGVLQENLIRDIANGVGVRSWVTGRRILSRAEQLDAERGAESRTALTGGQAAGMTEAGKTYAVSDHWQGTNTYPFLKAMETAFKAPGPRQLRTVWRTWTKFALGTTKHLLEQQHQIAGLGKAALREHGYAEAARANGFMGLVKRAFGLHGQMLDDAARGLFDPAKLRQMRATINRIYGKWTDLTPSAQSVLMFSPFGLWWANSAKFLARMPVDQPLLTSALAAGHMGTAKQRQQEGLDLFAPGHLPLYMQGGIPAGGDIIGQNYYSPFGIANDPLATGQSLLQPWLTPLVLGSLGLNWLGRPLKVAPGAQQTPELTRRLQYMLNSGLSSFLPFYTKLSQLVEGGGSPYDVSPGGIVPPLARGQAPAMRIPGKGPLVGLEKAARPWRAFRRTVPGSGGSTATGGTFGPSLSPSGSGFGPTLSP
jgi:hypothetical protein